MSLLTHHVNRLVQGIHNSTANALQLCLSCTYPSMCQLHMLTGTELRYCCACQCPITVPGHQQDNGYKIRQVALIFIERFPDTNFQNEWPDCVRYHVSITMASHVCHAVSNHRSWDCLLFDSLRWPMNSPHNGPVTWKKPPFDDVIMSLRAMSYMLATAISD